MKDFNLLKLLFFRCMSSRDPSGVLMKLFFAISKQSIQSKSQLTKKILSQNSKNSRPKNIKKKIFKYAHHQRQYPLHPFTSDQS